MSMITDREKPDDLNFTENLARTVFNSLSAHIAILDENSDILGTNKAWRDFAMANGMPKDYMFVGLNYLSICEEAEGDGEKDARRISEGIQRVIRGEVHEFLYDYPCHSPTSRHWYYLRAIRMATEEPVRVVVSHEDITDLKLAEEALYESRKALEEKTQALEEANVALKVLLKQRENDKYELEKKVLKNIKELVLPYLDKLKTTSLRPKEKTLVDILDTHLKDIVSPFLQRFTNANILLTPQEIQVASLVKDGKTSKEIADILIISEATVNFHRKNLRTKFGLKNKQTNLRTYLMSME